MSFTDAKKSFEAAQEIAEAAGDSAMEHIAAGLAEMAKSLSALKRAVDDVETKIKHSR